MGERRRHQRYLASAATPHTRLAQWTSNLDKHMTDDVRALAAEHQQLTDDDEGRDWCRFPHSYLDSSTS
jgi:hypothetical protein